MRWVLALPLALACSGDPQPIAAIATAPATLPDAAPPLAAKTPCAAHATLHGAPETPIVVRALPRSDAAERATLPAGTPVVLADSKGDWLKLVSATSDTTHDISHTRPAWVHGRWLRVGLASSAQPSPLYRSPDPSSAPIKQTQTGGAVMDCKGDWVKLRADNGPTGWLAAAHACAPDRPCALP